MLHADFLSGFSRQPGEIGLKHVLRAGVFTALVTALDARHRDQSSQLTASSRERLAELRERGFVNLGGIPGLDIADLAVKAAAHFGADEKSDEERQYVRHPFLFHAATTEVLRAERVNELVRAYLGPDATFDKVLLWRVAKASRTVKVSGLWHHDWCGRRLKLFVLLNDQSPNDRPTRYAIGSHKFVGKWAEYAFSRHSEEFVQSHFEVVPLVGKRGDAILFDTHGLHRATYEAGTGYRDALAYEYSSYGKSRLLAARGYQIGLDGDLLPASFDVRGTLLRAERLRVDGQFLRNGSARPTQSQRAIDYR